MAAVLAVALAAVLTGCGDDPPLPVQSPSPLVVARPTVRDQLAGRAALAKDQRYVATYRFAASGRPVRTVSVTIATDGSWMVSVPAGALGGFADVAVVKSSAGLFQCALGPAAGTAEARPDLLPVNPGCVRISKLTSSIDPRVEHLFTDWIDPLIDRESAIAVAAAPLLPGARGDCYSIEPNSAALASPVPPGIYCYDTTGTLTAVRVGFGTLTLTGAVAPAIPTVTMPAAVVPGSPLPLAAPPPPPSPGPTASP